MSIPLLYANGLVESVKSSCMKQFETAVDKSVKRMFAYDGELDATVARRLICKAFRDVYCAEMADTPVEKKVLKLSTKRQIESDSEPKRTAKKSKKSTEAAEGSDGEEKKKCAAGAFIKFQTDPAHKDQRKAEYQRLRVLPENKDRPEFTTFSKYCGMLWKGMSDAEKSQYLLQSKQEISEAHEYNKSHGLLSKRTLRDLESSQRAVTPTTISSLRVVNPPVVAPVASAVYDEESNSDEEVDY
jgi:hypothetical protein